MITCQNARDLFDRYLDGKLPPSLQAELHAHCLSCTSCLNELELLEACGDVIALDRSEPQLSASFTDNVLAARREQMGTKPTRPKRLQRRILYIGGPVAAAASVAIAFMLAWAVPPENNTSTNKKKALAGNSAATPKDVRDFLIDKNHTRLSAKAMEELEKTPEAPSADFVSTLLAPLVEKSRSTVDYTVVNAEELKHWFGQGFSNTNSRLIKLWRDHRSEQAESRDEDKSEQEPVWNMEWLEKLKPQSDETSQENNQDSL
jgi:hypothetical protein